MIGAVKRQMREWARFLADPDHNYALDEARLLEAMLLREQTIALLERIAHNTARADGRLERLELYLYKKDPDFPLAQRNEPEYRSFKKAVKAYEAEKAAILSGADED